MVRVSECWCRDGVQAERPVSTELKLAVIAASASYGASRIELASFASPDTWPQFADAAEVVAEYERRPGIEYLAYVPNARGYQRLSAIANFQDRVDTVLVAVAVTDSYNLKNVRRNTAQTLEQIGEVVDAATNDGLKVVGCVGTAWWCPVEGPVKPQQVLALSERLLDMGASEVMLGDTTGEANPRSAADLIGMAKGAFGVPVVGHFHDMRGTAMVNALAAVNAGADWIDCALGGVGGHPPDEHQSASAGNLCTEDFVALAVDLGIVEGLDASAAVRAGTIAQSALGRTLQSRIQQSGLPHQLALVSDPPENLASQGVL